MHLCVCVQVCVYLRLSVCTYVFANVSFVYMYIGVCGYMYLVVQKSKTIFVSICKFFKIYFIHMCIA